MSMDTADLQEELLELAAECTNDPVLFAQEAFFWGEDELEGEELEEWQSDVLADLRDGLITIDGAIRIAIAPGHGIGKSALVAIIILWSMAIYEDTMGVVTANTEKQLRTKTQPQLVKWHRLCVFKDWFKVTATAIFSADQAHERTWRIDLIPWSENNTEAFAGLHNKGKRIILIFDEASAIPKDIWEVAEGALTDSDTEIIFAVFGNPTMNTGSFKECFTKMKHRWSTRQIDSRTVGLSNKKQIKEWAEDYGEDSDFFKVRVRGMFPSLSVTQFISVEDIDAAYGKHLREEQYSFAPVVIGVDPAWTGEDDFTIWLRQGLMSKRLGKYPKNDNDMKMANIIAQFEDEYKADAVFVDMGYGTGIVSAGRTMNRNWTIVNFNEKSADLGCKNKRAEMINSVRKWLKDGGTIPEDPELHEQMVSVEIVPRNDGIIQIENKKDAKARGVDSPNDLDAIGLTFAHPVIPRVNHGVIANGLSEKRRNYKPKFMRRSA